MGEQGFGHILNRKSVYVKGDALRELDITAIKAELQSQVGPSHQVKIVVPGSSEGYSYGYAYLNFQGPDAEADAAQALDEWRFRLCVGGHPVRMFYVVTSKEGMSQVFGPAGSRFSVIVKQLSPDVDAQLLYDRFKLFGEIYQCKVDQGTRGETYGQIQYVDTASCERAIVGGHGLLFASTRIMVEQMRPRRYAYGYSGYLEEDGARLSRPGSEQVLTPSESLATQSMPSSAPPSDDGKHSASSSDAGASGSGSYRESCEQSCTPTSGSGEGSSGSEESGTSFGSAHSNRAGADGTLRWGDEDYDMTHGVSSDGHDEAGFYDSRPARPAALPDRGHELKPFAPGEPPYKPASPHRSYNAHYEEQQRKLGLHPASAGAEFKSHVPSRLSQDSREGHDDHSAGDQARSGAPAAPMPAPAPMPAAAPMPPAPAQQPVMAPPPPPAAQLTMVQQTNGVFMNGGARLVATSTAPAGTFHMAGMKVMPQGMQPGMPFLQQLNGQRLMQMQQQQQAAMHHTLQQQQQQQAAALQAAQAAAAAQVQAAVQQASQAKAVALPQIGSPCVSPVDAIPAVYGKQPLVPVAQPAIKPVVPPAVASSPVVRIQEAMGRKGAAPAKVLAKQLGAQLDKLAVLMECPITQEPFIDPVVAADGHTYERRAITDWLETHDVSPVTSEPLLSKQLVPNLLVKALAHDFM